MSGDAMSAIPVQQTSRFQEKQEAILRAAALLFNEQGVKGATLADIARSVGLVTNSVTYYYRKKEDLATACFLQAIEVFRTIARRARAEATVAARIRAFFRLHGELLAAIEDGSQPPIVLFHDLRALPSPQVDTVYGAYTDLFRDVRALLKGTESAGWSREDLNARGHMLLSLAHWLRPWIGRYETSEYGRILDRLGDIVIHGLAAPASCWSDVDGERDWRLAEAARGPSEAFLRAATALVNEQGYRGASVDRISARLNVTKGSFYHHHDNKQDLITACFERTFAVVRRALVLADGDGSASGWARASAITRALLRFQLSDEGPLLRVSAMSALPDQAHRDQVRRSMARLTERMHSVVVDGMVDGSIRPLDPAVAAQVAIALINAAVELFRWVPGVDADSVIALYGRPVMLGLLCGPGGGSRSVEASR